MSTDKYESMKTKAIKWRDKCIEYKQQLNKIEHTNGSQQPYNGLNKEHEIQGEVTRMTKKIHSLEIELERQNMRKDAEIDRLKFSLEDYKERYKEVRDDNKELRKYSKNN
jgi:hypothetical protein